MMVFPWLVALLLVGLLALAIASTPARVRSLRSRGSQPFAYPPLLTILLVWTGILVAFTAWLVLFGPPD